MALPGKNENGQASLSLELTWLDKADQQSETGQTLMIHALTTSIQSTQAASAGTGSLA
jgi:hypothetical protein